MKERLNEYFVRSEFACKCGCGFRSIDVELFEVLTDIRLRFNRPVIINSGCRCERHNKAIGGSSRSKHIFACAADIKVKDIPSHRVYEYLDGCYPDEYGIGQHDTFVHIDIRSTKWRERY